MTECLLSWETVLSHLHNNKVACRGILGTQILTTGSGPCDENEFDEFLKLCGISVYPIPEDTIDKLIIGHSGWSKDDLIETIQAREGGILKVYSQEMVLVSLALGSDIFEICTQDEIANFGIGHPALEFLMENMDFDWPTTDVTFNTNRLIIDFSDSEWPENGVLKQMGYSVGISGKSEVERHEILDRVLLVKLISGSDGTDSYIKEWGQEKSAQRLEKMANCIASFARNHKKITSRDYSEAISNWESDLDYLKSKYYRPQLRFRWPDTYVSGWKKTNNINDLPDMDDDLPF